MPKSVPAHHGRVISPHSHGRQPDYKIALTKKMGFKPRPWPLATLRERWPWPKGHATRMATLRERRLSNNLLLLKSGLTQTGFVGTVITPRRKAMLAPEARKTSLKTYGS